MAAQLMMDALGASAVVFNSMLAAAMDFELDPAPYAQAANEFIQLNPPPVMGPLPILPAAEPFQPLHCSVIHARHSPVDAGQPSQDATSPMASSAPSAPSLAGAESGREAAAEGADIASLLDMAPGLMSPADDVAPCWSADLGMNSGVGTMDTAAPEVEAPIRSEAGDGGDPGASGSAELDDSMAAGWGPTDSAAVEVSELQASAIPEVSRTEIQHTPWSQGRQWLASLPAGSWNGLEPLVPVKLAPVPSTVLATNQNAQCVQCNLHMLYMFNS